MYQESRTGRRSLTPHQPIEEEPQPAVIPRPPELYKPDDNPFEKPAMFPAKPLALPHSPKISPSSIPNPNPSVSTNKPPESAYPNYGGYLYSIPGYSAFQPVAYPSIVQPNPGPVKTEPPRSDFVRFSPMTNNEPSGDEKLVIDDDPKPDNTKQQDFEEHFTPEIVPAVQNIESHSKTQTESKMSITSITQGSGATVTIPNQINKDTRKKPERFSLKTSIPISKIDMKCVNNTVDTVLQNAITKPVFNPAFQKDSSERPRVEIQSNIIIKTASTDPEIKEKPPPPATQNNSISTLINAAEAISKNDSQFRVPEPKIDTIAQEAKKPASPIPQAQTAVTQRPVNNQVNLEKPNFPLKPPEGGYNNEQKNQIVYIQKKPAANSKMVVPQQNPQNPQVLLQRSNFESKNLQAPSRLSNQSKKSKEEIVADNGISSKVVALKRLHQDNCDENDFENLITENQIYGNKIVVKEKSQGTQQEQDLKIKTKDKQTQSETKNIVLQPNYVYVSNVQFPANLMMIKNNSKICQTTDSCKTKVSPNENKAIETLTTTAKNNNNNDNNDANKNSKLQNTANKEILKSSNNVLQSLSNNNNKKSEIVITASQKVIVSPQVVYQVITDKNPTVNEVPRLGAPKKDIPKLIEMKNNEKGMLIACQYKVDSKSPSKLVIANIRPNKTAANEEEVSSLDVYERRKRLRRLKYLTNNNNKEIQKLDPRKNVEKPTIINTKNIITPDKMRAEIFKEFTNKKDKLNADSDDSDSDFEEKEIEEYNSIIEEYGPTNQSNKVKFLEGLRLATHDVYREKDLEKQDRNLKHDSIATAYVTAGVLDRLINKKLKVEEIWAHPAPVTRENENVQKNKRTFLAELRLKHVTQKYKEAHEKTWQAVIRDRKRRYGESDVENKDTFDPNSQLQLLTEIKNSVNVNNNLIKKRLERMWGYVNSSDIRVLAEKNFSELNRLSKIADVSVKLLSGQETPKRDLNPGFDSENIKKPDLKLKSYKDYPNLIIPSLAKIQSLKTVPDVGALPSPAISMDEPVSSAGGILSLDIRSGSKEFGCQVGDSFPWPGLQSFMKSFREFQIARKKEINDIDRRNTALRVECAHITQTASRDSDRARSLLAELQHLGVEEKNLKLSLEKLCKAVAVLRGSKV